MLMRAGGTSRGGTSSWNTLTTGLTGQTWTPWSTALDAGLQATDLPGADLHQHRPIMPRGAGCVHGQVELEVRDVLGHGEQAGEQ